MMPLERLHELGGRPTQGRELRSRGRRTIERLLTAADTVVADRGHSAARVDDIVDEAGMSHGTFYLYFEDKDDLLRSMLRLTALKLQAVVDRIPAAFEDASFAAWLGSVEQVLQDDREVLRAGRALGSTDATDELRDALSGWLAALPGATSTGMTAHILVLALEDGAVHDRASDHAALTTAARRLLGF